MSVTFITPGYVRTAMTEVNLHHMPFLLELDDAVERMVRAIEKRKRLAAFPAPLAALVWLGQIFPGWLYDTIASRKGRQKLEASDGDPDAPLETPPEIIAPD